MRLRPVPGWLMTTGLVVLAAVIGFVSPVAGSALPPAALIVPILVAGLTVRLSQLLAVLVAAAFALAWDGGWSGVSTVYPAGLGVVVVAGVFAAIVARARTSLGVQGLRGEAMLVDLSERLLAHGEVPRLPSGWHSDVALRTAGGASFGGDFLVAARTGGGRLLEAVLVDVSGKGIHVGTRALQLSGAFGGLLGAVPPEEFLSSANDYLLRQRWDEGFATAVHLIVDLDAGDFRLESAGHLPAVQFLAGSGAWRLTHAEGAVLGVLPKAEYGTVRGWMAPGDLMMLFTDGLVEAVGRDIDVGIDKLVGEAERLVTRGFYGGASRLIGAVAADAADDRAVVLLWRD